MLNKSLFSSKSDSWATPQTFFDELNREFNFTLDPCASLENAKCSKFFTKEQNGLLQDWSGERVFCNPPYSDIKNWVKKCYDELLNGTKIVLLIPARTDTKYFHSYIYKLPNVEIRFVKGRLKFGNSKNSAPFPSMLIIYNDHEKIDKR